MSATTQTKPGLMLSSELEPVELVRLAQVAEQAGYDELWYTDQRFWRDCYAGLTLIAGKTQQIRLGPGVNDPFTRHPALMAMSIATLDELSGGRAQLGLGVGGSGIAQMQLRKERPVRALREAIEIVRLMLTGQKVTYDGEVFPLDGASLGFRPVREHIPISIATHGPQVLSLSGKLADGVLLGNMGTRDAIDAATSIVASAASAVFRSTSAVTINLRLEAIISDRGNEAMSVMRGRMAHRLIVSYPKWTFLGDHQHRLDPGIATAAAARDQPGVERLLTDADVRATALVGTPEEAARQLATLMTSTVDRVTIRPYGVDGVNQDVTIRHFAESVWPAVAG